jgi:hypothetical protein
MISVLIGERLDVNYLQPPLYFYFYYEYFNILARDT